MSTNCQPTDNRSVLRKRHDGSSIQLPCPNSIVTYIQFLGGVDRGDQIRGYYHCRKKCRKFYRYIFFFLFDVSITNFYILHKESHPAAKLNSKVFRLQLPKELIGEYNTQKKRGRPKLSISRLPLTHYPVRDEEIGSRHKKGRCSLHSSQNQRSLTTWYCRKSEVWLCHSAHPSDDCFLQWHTKLTLCTIHILLIVLHIILFTANQMRLKKLKSLKTKVTM